MLVVRRQFRDRRDGSPVTLFAVTGLVEARGPSTLIKDYLAGGASLRHPNAAAALGTPGLKTGPYRNRTHSRLCNSF